MSFLLRMLFLSALALASYLAPVIATAQSVGSTDPITLSVSPDYPAPYGQITITPSSGLLTLSSASFVLSVNGKEIYRGNAKPVAISLGAGGTATTIRGTLIDSSGSYSTSVLVRPQDVALVIEPVSSAPALYLGKPLVPLEGTARIVAVANMRTASGVALDPNTLFYAWTVDNAQIGSVSGAGKTSIVVNTPLQYRQSTVSVSVSNADGTLVGGDSVTLSGNAPSVRIYENDSLLGIRFDHALSGSYSLNAAEEMLFGVPYSFPLANGAPTLAWFLNSVSAQGGSGITLRPTGTGKGSASVSLTATSKEGTTASTNIQFGFGSGSTNIFGL